MTTHKQDLEDLIATLDPRVVDTARVMLGLAALVDAIEAQTVAIEALTDAVQDTTDTAAERLESITKAVHALEREVSYVGQRLSRGA